MSQQAVLLLLVAIFPNTVTIALFSVRHDLQTHEDGRALLGREAETLLHTDRVYPTGEAEVEVAAAQ